jgi:hypothetical protein
MSNLTPEEKADSICRWTNQGLRELVIEAIREARSEGAQVERAECVKIAESESALSWVGGSTGNAIGTARNIARAIRERGNQAERKVGE